MRLRTCLFGALLLAAPAALLSCNGDNASGPTTGTLEVTTTTNGVALDLDRDGYTVSVDGGAPQPIATNSTLIFSTVPGAHEVGLSGVAANCGIEGDNPRTVTVTGDTLAVTFSITCSKPASTRIAFLSSRDGNDDIFAMDSDGTGQTNLTHNPADDREAEWSPDGRRILFRSNRDNVSGGNIFVMNADGTGQTRLTQNADDFLAAWSPDGLQIAFTSFRNEGFEIDVMNSDGSNPTKLADGGLPRWSPDGRRIAFIGDRIDVINADGTGESALTSFSDWIETDFAWSPDGQRIAFTRFAANEDESSALDLWVMNSDGSSQISLTNFVPAPGADGHVYGFSWSPDSQKLVFAANGEIYVSRADGTDQTKLTSNPDLGAYGPSWSPDGGRILFSAPFVGTPDLFVMNADGSGLRNLTNNPAADEGGAWQP